MKIGILLTARLGSTRLKKKHLLPVQGRPIFSFLIERIENEFKRELTQGDAQIVIATSSEPENKLLESFCSDHVKIFYGSTNNIPLRHLETARAFSLDAIVSVDGDDVFCSPKGMRLIFEKLRRHTAAKTDGLPFGMNSWGYSTRFLEASLSSHSDAVLETGWGRVFDPAKIEVFPVQVSEKASSVFSLLRFTLDYDEDFRFFDQLISLLRKKVTTASDEEIIDLVLSRELYKINGSLTEAYWARFHRKKSEEAGSR